MDNFSRTQRTRKLVLPTRGGVVAANHRRAAEVGAAVLAAGGDAVDAAVATSFAIGVVEPWMSGPAAGGAMLLWRASEGKAIAIDYGMRAPRELDPADYPLAPAARSSADLFNWPPVLEDRNVRGATAVAVPGVVAGMDLAHRRFGRMPWRELLQPAVELAQRGMLVDWYSSLLTTGVARSLAQDPDAARMFLDDGCWPKVGTWTGSAEQRLDQKAMAATLARLAQAGAADFYRGEVAQALVRDVRAKGGSLSAEDLASYEARAVAPLAIDHRGARVFAAPGLTGGPTLAQALGALATTLQPARGRPAATSYLACAAALEQAFARRLAGMGDSAADPGEASGAPACTTHFSIVDPHGNFCAVTQTLLSIFGSRTVSPATGLLLNNGIMWFDPTPGRPNSLAPGKRTLCNYCPVVGQAADGRRFALGASGGRKIVGAVMQIASFLSDHGLSLEEAFHTPRIDVSGTGTVTADETLPAEVLAALRAAHPLALAARSVYPFAFACPSAVLREGETNMGCTEIMSPWGDAVHEDEAQAGFR